MNKVSLTQKEFLSEIEKIKEKVSQNSPLTHDEIIFLLTHYLQFKETRKDQGYNVE